MDPLTIILVLLLVVLVLGFWPRLGESRANLLALAITLVALILHVVKIL